jgi:hypothetical protein
MSHGLLRSRRNRPRYSRPAEQRDELASLPPMPRRRQYFGTAEGAGPHFGQLRRYGGAVFGQMEVDNDIRSALRAILPADQPPAVSTSIGRVRLWRVTLSRKGAKSRTRGRKLHLTGTKARVAGSRQIRADLEQQLKTCRREIAHAREHLVEAMKRF